MKKTALALCILLVALLSSLKEGRFALLADGHNIDSLRRVYSRSSDRWPRPTLDEGVEHHELDVLVRPPLEQDSDSVKALVQLGKTLFFDPRLSGSNQISCGSCHTPELSWTDGRTLSIGHAHRRTKRNAPTLDNVWYMLEYFWDGRAKTLEEQALGPITSPDEMHQDFKALPKKIAKIKGYRPLFRAVYGDHKVTGDRITSALATFQKTISSNMTDFDFFLSGSANAMTDQQVLGLHLFRTKARCLNCHNGPFFTDNKFHNINTAFYKDKRREDLGLYDISGKTEDIGKFRTPSLRNIEKTAPYFHNGVTFSLDALMAQYNSGMTMLGAVHYEPSPDDPMRPVVTPLIQPLNLTTEEIRAVVAFMKSLTSFSNVSIPELPK